ncbi:L,D-transpeptidase [Paenibacillus chungangensis]|uniref:L,D-transpeptidase n=1 Tax=Paenibacillus chungangensis TaxID=696535 RepID=A0ABW3HM51_9BACL
MKKPDDILYLKQFVKQHPDNKMGWYLLGKHYREAGKDGKANYCFIQAGDIYDAYEQESHPLAHSEQQLEELKRWDRTQKKRKLWRRTALAAAILLIVTLLIPYNQFGRKDTQPDNQQPAATTTAAARLAVGVIFIPQAHFQPVGYAMEKLMEAGGGAPRLTLAASLGEEGGMMQWISRARLYMTADRSQGGNPLELKLLDREACLCEPWDRSRAEEVLKDWKKRQETHWVLGSGIMQYKRIYGKWPESLNDLIRPYPNNILSGEGDGMGESFSGLLEVIKKKAALREKDSQDSGEGKVKAGAADLVRTVSSNGLYDEAWDKPLEVIVDTDSYQLAVVQNNIVIRSYTVGLGGDKTPEGDFYISEKVRNPKGSQEGMFGTRGMTLSGSLYAIHGTNEPDSIGKDESLGCIRMRDTDVEELYDLVPLGTRVTIKGGKLPFGPKQPENNFSLVPKQDESNPSKVYQWLT